MKTNLLVNSFLTVVCSLLVISSPIRGAELAKVGTHLKLMDPLTTFRLLGEGNQYFAAGRGSKFKIVFVDQDNCYVEFYKVEGINDQAKSPSNLVLPDRRYRIAKAEITEKVCQFTRGWYAATLTVPFKYRFKLKDAPSALSTEFDISGAVGYSKSISGGPTITPVAFLGLAAIALGDTNSSEVETRVGLTGGLGFSFTISANFQIAAMGGVDLLTGSIAETWPYQNKVWVSVGIGYKFLDL